MTSVSQWLDGAKIGVVGLGYVGLPLAVEFGKRFPVIGFDIKADRVAALQRGHDETLETEPEELAAAEHLRFSTDAADLAGCNIYIVTVPTPIDRNKRPDLRPLINASRTVGAVLKKGDVVIYESTVYPGCTEEDCVPELERVSGLKFNEDFTVGYSPERINPGDKEHRLPTIRKITSGSTPETLERVDALYREIITAGTFPAASVQVAEAAKVIENTQRDLNIALVNELSIIFNRLGIDTQAVLEAAGTKWNFLPFRPGLVGGHCIGVDPYYLTHKAEAIGYNPQVILSGRRINDGMGNHVADQVMKLMIRKGINPVGARALVLGLTFKENCPDLRNSRVIDVVEGLADYNIGVDLYDPWAAAEEVIEIYGQPPAEALEPGVYDAVIIAVAHGEFVAMGEDGIAALGKPGRSAVYDVKWTLPAAAVDGRL